MIMLTGFGNLMNDDERPPYVDVVLGKPIGVNEFMAAVSTVMKPEPVRAERPLLSSASIP